MLAFANDAGVEAGRPATYSNHISSRQNLDTHFFFGSEQDSLGSLFSLRLPFLQGALFSLNSLN